MKASLTGAVLILVGLIFIAVFAVNFCMECQKEKIILQYTVMLFGILLVLIGIAISAGTNSEPQHIHYRHRQVTLNT